MRRVAATLLVCTSARELTFPTEYTVGSDTYEMSLQAIPFSVDLDDGTDSGTLFYTRGYGIGGGAGTIPGPVFRMSPGDTLKINLKNDLNKDYDCATTGTEFCEANTTNLHTHGLHVSSAGVDSTTGASSDSIFVEISPGEEQLYEFTIPDYHAPGTHWYHPHHHHATALQAGGGAAGVIIVDDPDDYLPSDISDMEEKILFVSYHSFSSIQTIAQNSLATMLDSSEDIITGLGLSEGQYLVNGLRNPTMTINEGQWYRLRMIFAAVTLEWIMSLTSTDGGYGSCTANLLAKDGIYLGSVPRSISEVPLYPGARADIALSCSCSISECTFASSDEDAYNIMTLVVTGNQNSASDLETWTPTRPCYLADLQNADVTDRSHTLSLDGRNLQVQMDGVGDSMNYANTHGDVVSSISEWVAMGTLTAGDVVEFEVDGANGHPLHIHVSPYQIISMPDDSYNDGYFQVGDWHDTLQLSDLGFTDTFTIRMQTDSFTGKMVVHCHILSHEDQGMMNFIDVDGTEGSMWKCAESLDSTCYSTAYSARSTKAHSVDIDCLAEAPDAASSPSTSSDSNTGLYIGLGFLAAAAGGALLFVALRRKNQSNPATELVEVDA